jgi:hypothetical protein
LVEIFGQYDEWVNVSVEADLHMMVVSAAEWGGLWG